MELLVDGGAAFPARYGPPYKGAHDEPLTLYYPAYPEYGQRWLCGELPAQALARGSADVRTVVVNAAGTRTEIDRRQLITEAR